MNKNKKTIGFKKNIKNHGLIFHYNIRADLMLGIFMLLLYGYHKSVLHV